MGTLVIEDIDETLLCDLVSLAAENRMQVQAQVHHILRQAIPARDRHVLAARLDEIAAMTPKDRGQVDSLEVLREHRDK